MSTPDRAEAAQIAALCVECGVPHLAADFLGAGLSLDEVKTRVSTVGAVQEIVATAGRVAPGIKFDFATAMLAAGSTVPQIRAAVFEAMVAEQAKTEISSHIPLGAGNAGVDAARASMRRVLKAQGLTPTDEAGA